MAAETTPTVRIYQSLNFSDDMNFLNLDQAIDRQLAFYDTLSLSGEIRFGTKSYPKKVLRESLVLLKNLALKARQCQKARSGKRCQDEFDREMNEKFALYKPVPKSTESGYQADLTTKFTSYYSPDLQGSRTRRGIYQRAIYRKPSNPVLANSTRVDIDYHGALAGSGHEIFYVSDSFYDLYLLHVQGGGRITVNNLDGTKEIKYLSFDGKNSRPFKMIYHYLIQRGYVSADDAGIPGQRRFLAQNPHKEEEVFATCPSYVYFKESDEEPIGLDDIPLTEGRSVALDQTVYKSTGLINFVKTKKASHLNSSNQVVKVPFSRFFIGQDTGGAIKGNARCDLYFGYGPKAELTAYNMNDMGEQYFLIKK